MAQEFSFDKLYSVEGRIALVTGGGTGIGWMIARGLATNGAKVYITGRRAEVLEKAASEFNQHAGVKGSVVPLTLDVTDRAGILAAQETIASKEGKLHILVNNAGQTGPVSSPWFNDPSAPEHKDPETLGRALFNSGTFESWADVFGVNTFSIYFLTTAFLGLLAKGSADVEGYTSCVINITSISGYNKLAQMQFAYNATKAAATHLTKMLATEFALKKIPVRVNGIAPGVYESEMTYDHIPPEKVDEIGKPIVSIPAKRPGTAQEMAGTAIYIASRAGCYMTGKEIVIDGGYTAVNPATI